MKDDVEGYDGFMQLREDKSIKSIALLLKTVASSCSTVEMLSGVDNLRFELLEF